MRDCKGLASDLRWRERRAVIVHFGRAFVSALVEFRWGERSPRAAALHKAFGLSQRLGRTDVHPRSLHHHAKETAA